MTPAELFPELRPWVENLANVWPVPLIQPWFGQFQVLHILSLVILGGVTILINLRLIGAGLTDEPASEVDRNLRGLLNFGVVGVIVTGLLIGVANAERLYDSAAFSVKMVGLLAAVIFTYLVSSRVARADGRVDAAAAAAALVALAIWALAMWIFVTAQLINPGVFHVITAGALIVAFVTHGRLRWLYLAGLALLVAVQTVWTHAVIDPEDFAALDPVNKGFAWVFALWILGAAAVGVFGRRTAAADAGRLPALIGYTAILMWVSVAAAGRWIAFA